MVIPAAGRAYNIPSARDPKRWNLSIFLGNQPWGPTLGPNLVMHTIFLPESWIFRFVKNIISLNATLLCKNQYSCKSKQKMEDFQWRQPFNQPRLSSMWYETRTHLSLHKPRTLRPSGKIWDLAIVLCRYKPETAILRWEINKNILRGDLQYECFQVSCNKHWTHQLGPFF